MRRNAGITLLELLLTMAMTAVLLMALSHVYGSALQFGPKIQAARDRFDASTDAQQRIKDLLSHAWLSSTATDQISYFTTNPQPPTGGAGQPAATTNSNSSSTTGLLVFTAIGRAPNGAVLSPSAMSNTDNDFETLNQNYGPQGGVSEYALELTPVGNAADKKGLFLREQHPADIDPTQGGYESLLIPNVDSMTFEFWDGTTWEQSWDTTTMTPRKRLPAAVRLTYTITGSSDQHVFVVGLPLSDVTALNPVAQSGTTVAGG